MAQLISVRLQRTDNTPWGFRLQGGKDFGSPLVIQKVNGNSIAERAGLQAGDAVLRVNSSDVFNLRHKEAQDTIVRAGPNFEITVQRGSQTWKPSVIPTGNIPTPSPHINNNVTVTKTSLVSNTPPQKPIGTGHNVQPKPFLNGNSDLKLVNKQYNSPMALYSEESIAETLSAQTEVLPTGALGVNFKKNERSYNAEKSEVLKMLQEAENDPKDAEPENNEHQGVVTSPAPVNVAGLRHVTAPITAPPSQTSANKSGLQPGQNICADCERLIVGVFVRIKDKNLHVECFKCSTCGTSLKNVGYYNINNKLYCDIHAKLAARSNQPGPNLVPVTIPPGGKIPAGTISAALASHPLPSAGPLSPSSNSSGPLPPYSILNTTTNNFDENLSKVDDVVDYSQSKLKSDIPKLNVDHVKTFANNLIMKETPQFNNNNDLNNKLNRKFDEVNNSDKKVYLTEAKINVNNDLIIENGLNNRFEKVIDLNNEIKKKPSSSVLSGPRPFSSNAAPLSPLSPVSAPTNAAPFSNHAATLPRAATQNLPVNNNLKLPPKPQNGYHTLQKQNSDTKISDPVSVIGKAITKIPDIKTSLNSEIRNFEKPKLKQTNFNSSIVDNNKNYKNNLGPKPFSKIQNGDVDIKPKQNGTTDNKYQNGTTTVTEFKNNILNRLNDSNLKNNDFITTNSLNGKTEKNEKLENDEMLENGNVLHDNNVVALNGNCNTVPWKISNNNTPIIDLVEGNYPVCVHCNDQIKRGPFITALGKIWCPEHFICATPSCRRPLQDLGFVEERGQLYCEYCFEQYLAPTCDQCHSKVKGDCLKAIGKHFHPDCFKCGYCGKMFGNNPFFLEDGLPYCEADWNELFTTKCFACGFPVEAGDRWVEALNNNYHSQCFNCTMCKKNLEGQSFYAKGGRPFCKNHAR